MNRSTPWLLLALAGCHRSPASLAASCLQLPASLPAALDAGPGLHPALRLFARGSQRYTCTVSDAGAAWGPAVPDAELHACAPDGALVGRHFAGPTWEWSADHSRFVGDKAHAVSVPSSGANVPWLVIPRKGDGDGGTLGAARVVERIETVGGLPPRLDAGCNASGATVQVPYSASYVFFEPD